MTCALRARHTVVRSAAALALAWLPLAHPLWGQIVRSGHDLPQALEHITAAAGICRRDALAENGASNWPAAALAAPDATCALTVQQAAPLLGAADAAFIDLRPAGDYASFHIPGALQLASSDLYAKPYWRRKKVLLIGSGKAEHELQRECARLKQAGYGQVHVLHGGIAQWLHQGQPIVGPGPTAAQLADMARLTAAELWLESQNPNNLLLLDAARSAMQSEFAAAQVLQQTSPDAIRAALHRQQSLLAKTALASIVLVADLPDSTIAAIARALLPTPLLVYRDTPDAFASQIATHKAIWAAQERGPKQPGCGS